MLLPDVHMGQLLIIMQTVFSGTWINGINCSGMTAYEAEQALAEKVQDYSIQVASREQEPQVITGDQILL